MYGNGALTATSCTHRLIPCQLTSICLYYILKNAQLSPINSLITFCVDILYLFKALNYWNDTGHDWPISPIMEVRKMDGTVSMSEYVYYVM